MRRVVVESPYSSGTLPSIPAVVERNKRYLRACLRACVLLGETPYASHGLLTQEGVLRDEDPEERSLGIKAGFAMRPALEASVFFTDLGWTVGMAMGKEDAEALVTAQKGLNVATLHILEERKLGGEWAECIRSHVGIVCPGYGRERGPWHHHVCAFWRTGVSVTLPTPGE